MTDRNDPLEWMAEINKKHHYNHERTVYASEWKTLREILKAQAEEVSQKDARIARLEQGLESAKRDLRRAAMSGPDTGHYPAFHEVCELLAEHPRQSAAAIKAEALREYAVTHGDAGELPEAVIHHALDEANYIERIAKDES